MLTPSCTMSRIKPGTWVLSILSTNLSPRRSRRKGCHCEWLILGSRQRRLSGTVAGWALECPGIRVRVEPSRSARDAPGTARFVAGPPGSYATIKRTINARAYDDFAELLDLEAVLQQERASSKDFIEGVTAFVQKRPAHFTGE